MGKVLIIADQKGEGCALPRGLRMAALLGQEAEVVAFEYAPLAQLKLKGNGKAAVKSGLLERRRKTLEGFIDKNAAEGQKVSLRVLWEKDVAPWVCARCESGKYSYVVKTGRRTETLVHTSTDWALLRNCAAPVLIVAENQWRRTHPVMAALDLASSGKVKKQLNETILATAQALALAMDEKLEIICAVEVPALLRELDLVDTRSYVADARAAMAPQVKSLAEKFSIPARAFKVKRGPVEKVIASEAAARRAQLVVMGTVGRKGIKARLIGNTAERVLQHLKTDVLAIRP
ncbi:universal stress protein [Haliea sp. E17]|uniref:universal stress protein n=1 Tax=Haliea sp. E17 TaxID=3401576 RepID=UPI003AAF907D